MFVSLHFAMPCMSLSLSIQFASIHAFLTFLVSLIIADAVLICEIGVLYFVICDKFIIHLMLYWLCVRQGIPVQNNTQIMFDFLPPSLPSSE